MVSLQNQIRWCVRAQLTLAGIVLLIAVAFYLFGYRPMTQQQKNLDLQIQTMQRELLDNMARSRILPQVALEVKNLRLSLDGAKKLPKDVDISGFIQDLTSISQSTQLHKPNYDPDHTPKRGEMFSLYTIHLQLQGNFNHIFQFIRETESLPRLSRVRSIEIKSDPKAQGDVIVNLGMDLYFSPDMQMAQTVDTSSLTGLGAAIKRDPKKATVLAVLFAVLAAMVGKLTLGGGSSAPKSAAAMPPAMPVLPASADSNNKRHPQDTTGLLREWIAQPLPQTVSRNIFEVKLEYYPMENGVRASEDSRTPDDPTFWDRLAKSIDAQADQQHKREILIQNLRQQAGQLQLTMALMGNHPQAMINGQMVGEGEVVAQFRVLKIEARSVVVEREGIKLEIPMK